jgi:hypothetical protein
MIFILKLFIFLFVIKSLKKEKFMKILNINIEYQHIKIYYKLNFS